VRPAGKLDPVGSRDPKLGRLFLRLLLGRELFVALLFFRRLFRRGGLFGLGLGLGGLRALGLGSSRLVRAGRLDFAAPDTGRFPCLALAFRALAGDAGLPIVLNAANEVAVSAFLDRRISFPAISALIGRAMDAYEQEGPKPVRALADVRAIDRWARDLAAAAAAGGVQSRV